MPYRSAILSAVEDLKDHQTGSPASAIRGRIKEYDPVFASALDDSEDDTVAWNETLFQTTLKSLVTKGTLVQINGSNYKFSDEELRARAEGLRARAESMEDQRRRAATATAVVGVSGGGGGGAQSSMVIMLQHPREEPPKGLPKKKTVHAKVKLNEGKIITVVNPNGKGSNDDEDEMETEDEDEDFGINNIKQPHHVV
eukprot:CAMPEP_0183723356 /NCGR_PEP_ID=MMETSP0737-20130205/14948_1 /TAXON_ID=385413 /ORGANISM="Thalassiosira miniscula, Strain CCMP1093" /LENGTH=197 /DNA_ID=CAMNT_0025953617 /DNA_START=251 /DNA_END=844 /DNA_ORIENTATION=+